MAPNQALLLQTTQEQEVKALETVSRFKIEFMGQNSNTEENRIVPRDKDMEEIYIHNLTFFRLKPSPLTMKIVSWSCNGATSLEFREEVLDLIQKRNPRVLVLMDTCTSLAQSTPIISSVPFDSWSATPAVGESGGKWVLWNYVSVHAMETHVDKRLIHLHMSMKPNEAPH